MRNFLEPEEGYDVWYEMRRVEGVWKLMPVSKNGDVNV